MSAAPKNTLEGKQLKEVPSMKLSQHSVHVIFESLVRFGLTEGKSRDHYITACDESPLVSTVFGMLSPSAFYGLKESGMAQPFRCVVNLEAQISCSCRHNGACLSKIVLVKVQGSDRKV